jgi:hypothetical protein
MKRFMLNFTLNQKLMHKMQNNIPTVHISEIHCYIVKSTNLSTIFGVLYKKYNKILIYRVAMATPT